MEFNHLSIVNCASKWLQDGEAQALIVAGLSTIGAWVILSWLTQVSFNKGICTISRYATSAEH